MEGSTTEIDHGLAQWLTLGKLLDSTGMMVSLMHGSTLAV
jgi:hypothetical protein